MALTDIDSSTSRCPAGEIPYVELMEGVEVKVLMTPADNDGPTEVVFVIDKGMVILADDDQLLLIEDAWSITEMYLGALAARGIPAPPQVLP